MNVTARAVDHFMAYGEKFGDALLYCIFHGWVVKRRGFLLLATEILAYPEAGIVSVSLDGPKNCWFLWYLGHEPGAFTPYDYMAEAPYPHRFVAYRRRSKIVVRDWDRLRRDFNVRTKRGEIKDYGRSTPSASAESA